MTKDDVFDFALSLVLRQEGGFSDNPADHGGATNFGISLRFLRDLPIDKLKKYGIFEPVSVETIRNLTLDQAKNIYFHEFWEGKNFDKIIERNITAYLFDCCVNLGHSTGIRIMQQAICAAKSKRNAVSEDGILGDATVIAINEVGIHLLAPMIALRAGYYRFLANTYPRNGRFLDGWLNRTYGFLDKYKTGYKWASWIILTWVAK